MQKTELLIGFCQCYQLWQIWLHKEKIGKIQTFQRLKCNNRHVKVGNTDKTLGFCGEMKRCAQKITPVVITYLPIRSNFGMVRKVVKISIFRFPGESACTENTRRSIECITKCLQNLQQKKKVFECIHAAAFCMLLGKSKAKFLK